MSNLIVAKFGGTSLATGHSFDVVRQRMAKNNDMRLVVVSAPGKVNDTNDPQKKFERDQVKVTDRLLAIAKKARANQPLEEDIRGIEKRFGDLENSIGMTDGGVRSRIAGLIRERAGMLNDDDAPLASLGEELNARLFAAYLTMQGIKARYVDPAEAGFQVSVSNGQAVVGEDRYAAIEAKMQKLLDRGERVVFPGFYGHDDQGAIRTFARGGSDYTGSVLAAALRAGLYQNFTDTDGIRMVEPAIATDAPVIRMMTHRELTELTLGGAFGVFQYEAAVPLAINGIVTQVLNTFNPNSVGTYILPQRNQGEMGITGIVHRGEFVAFEVVKYGGANTVGFFRDVLQLFSDMGVSVEHAPSSTNDISIIVRKKSIDMAGTCISDIVSAIREHIAPHQIKLHEMSAVVVVGEDVSRTMGLNNTIFEAVREAGVNVPYHSHQGISFILWLNNGDAKKVAEAIYKLTSLSGSRLS